MDSRWDIRGIIFDMDGVLCASEPFMEEAACRMFKEQHGADVVPTDFHPFSGTGEDQYLGGVAKKYGVTLRMPADKDRAYEIYLDMIKGRLPPLPGAVDFIAGLRRRGMPLAVASSADRVKVNGNLKQIGIPPETFKAVVTGTEIARKKPFPDLFLAAAVHLGLPPAQCMVVEDTASGIRAAKAAGCACLGLTTSFPEARLREHGPDWIAADLAHAAEVLRGEPWFNHA